MSVNDIQSDATLPVEGEEVLDGSNVVDIEITEAKQNSLSNRLARINILVVDNDDKVIKLITSILHTLGFTAVLSANDGFEAMTMISKRSVDLIITDWALRPMSYGDDGAVNHGASSIWSEFPPINGASFVESLRHSKQSPNPFIPVIMMTSPIKMNTVKAARDAGVNEILVKPLVARSLCDRMVSVIERPRIFVTSEDYKGPCRRRKYEPHLNHPERRKRNVQVVRFSK